jgi:hypothetical protein
MIETIQNLITTVPPGFWAMLVLAILAAAGCWHVD